MQSERKEYKVVGNYISLKAIYETHHDICDAYNLAYDKTNDDPTKVSEGFNLYAVLIIELQQQPIKLAKHSYARVLEAYKRAALQKEQVKEIKDKCKLYLEVFKKLENLSKTENISERREFFRIITTQMKSQDRSHSC